jgi:predicted 2-oxoglutarate/Fe(II)-dependent dioxygenase YbiX
MEELAPGIALFNNVFLTAQEWVDKIENSVLNGESRWRGAATKSNPTGEIDYTKSRVTYTLDPISEEFNSALDREIKPFINVYSTTYGCLLDDIWEPAQLLKYGVGMRFTNHIDDHPGALRRVSYSFYINGNYDGGEIEFPRFGIKVKPRANQLLVFPSNYVYNHIVHEVKDGVRYAVVQWVR